MTLTGVLGSSLTSNQHMIACFSSGDVRVWYLWGRESEEREDRNYLLQMTGWAYRWVIFRTLFPNLFIGKESDVVTKTKNVEQPRSLYTRFGRAHV